jgi:hypothetical protein
MRKRDCGQAPDEVARHCRRLSRFPTSLYLRLTSASQEPAVGVFVPVTDRPRPRRSVAVYHGRMHVG